MSQRIFAVVSKGLRGKNKVPAVTCESEEGDKLLIILGSKQDLATYEIDQEFMIALPLPKSKQAKLPGA